MRFMIVFTSFISGVLLRRNSSSLGSAPFRKDTVRRRSLLVVAGKFPIVLLLWFSDAGCGKITANICINTFINSKCEFVKILQNIPASFVFSVASTDWGVAGADYSRIGAEKKIWIILLLAVQMGIAAAITSWSACALVAGVFGAGDIGSGVFAPLESAWLSVRRLARDRVLYGNFRNVENFFRSSANARSWRCWNASTLMSSLMVPSTVKQSVSSWIYRIRKWFIIGLLTCVFNAMREKERKQLTSDSGIVWISPSAEFSSLSSINLHLQGN